MSLITPVVKTTFANRIREFEEMDGPALTTNRATATLVQNQLNEGVTRGFSLIQDEPKSAAGTAQGPTPTDFFIQAVAFCENVVFARNAALNDVDVQALETTVAGEWDMKGATLARATTLEFKLFVNDVEVPL